MFGRSRGHLGAGTAAQYHKSPLGKEELRGSKGKRGGRKLELVVFERHIYAKKKRGWTVDPYGEEGFQPGMISRAARLNSEP